MHYLDLAPLPARTAVRWADFPHDDRAPVSAAAHRNIAYFHDDRDAADRQFPGISDHMAVAGTHALAHLPLIVDGHAFGTLGLAWAAPHRIDADTQALLTIAAGAAAHALDRTLARVTTS